MAPSCVAISQRPRPSPGSMKATGVPAPAGKSPDSIRVEISTGAPGVQLCPQETL